MTTRTSRKESTAITRQLLLDAASRTFLRDGYANARIDNIAAGAGFTRGAFYAHFASKQEAFFALIEEAASKLLPDLIDRIKQAPDKEAAIEVVCRWADERGDAQDMGILMIEALRQIQRTDGLNSDYLRPLRGNWRQIGNALSPLLALDRLDATPEEIGAIVLELTYAPSLGPDFGPTPGRLLRITLNALGS